MCVLCCSVLLYLNSSIGRCSECFFSIISHCDTNLALPESFLKQILRSKKTSVVVGNKFFIIFEYFRITIFK